ncbi:hypothetical protein [Kitasatospora phosalacinea]|uniref:HEAT repeat domain-containing protein n=1 Tax=Kitasatospora phosalacinea TaxID=2065 RepID=A0A9W6PFK9_9ACTN|nr:hypothetical protein [Kitasatospora phosalacinea]GLW54079.1 hypothetical protein Kpho01_20900 [Kitasatospora phosalacinea]
MESRIPDPRAILAETDWSGLEHAYGPAAPETPLKLAGLLSGEPAAAEAALDHLWGEVLHQGSLCSATAPVACYVAALLYDAGSGEFLDPKHRRRLLSWLAESAYTVSDHRERQLEEWFGPDRTTLFREFQEIRPRIFLGVAPHLHSPAGEVQEAALLAAAHLLDDPRLHSYRSEVSPMIRTVLAESVHDGHREVAARALASWEGDAGGARNE